MRRTLGREGRVDGRGKGEEGVMKIMREGGGKGSRQRRGKRGSEEDIGEGGGEGKEYCEARSGMGSGVWYKKGREEGEWEVECGRKRRGKKRNGLKKGRGEEEEEWDREGESGRGSREGEWVMERRSKGGIEGEKMRIVKE
ncbi:hypothetical protein Pcinc_042965 [Petrolisthes cinctipes]|uniref:Uncharacterized protein n=1 Tax=Petrolisthes cinctipes TaxID=88211 RepID=A0AAE1BHB9_PETCI|nr:hypothetical protein Pcinc_042965 [Petrolisthes cinctipes]